ncbi:MAG TPA: type 1 glutamine amidotransferase domain-containing protein [Bacteriovoracaceae bacterium]|nr:type 1 glutamine amidotransferase domain-containing protein [Bacteriovoracaceae bacterium]
MNKKALIVVTNNNRLGNSGVTGWFMSEVSHVYFPLKDEHFQVEFASPKGGNAPLDPASLTLDDPENKCFELEFEVENSLPTKPLYEINPQDYQVVFFAGGHGTMWDFPDNEDIQRITREIYENGGIVGAVCHGPAALVNVKLSNGKYLVEGKEVNSFTDSEEREVGKHDVVPFLLESKLRERGAKFVAGKNWENKVVVSERLITGQNPQSATGVGEAIVDKYNEMYLGSDEGVFLDPGL